MYDKFSIKNPLYKEFYLDWCIKLKTTPNMDKIEQKRNYLINLSIILNKSINYSNSIKCVIIRNSNGDDLNRFIFNEYGFNTHYCESNELVLQLFNSDGSFINDISFTFDCSSLFLKNRQVFCYSDNGNFVIQYLGESN